MLKVEHLAKRFGEKQLFEDLSFACRGGLILRAPSGWGKTTLMRILMGLETADAGSVTGVGRVCPLFQENRLIPHLDAVQNVQIVCGDLAAQKITAELAAVGLGAKECCLPAARLSGGQKRRVALIRALLAPGDLVLLDEPFTGLDEASAALAAKDIHKHCAGRTALAAVHDPLGIQLLGWPVLNLTNPAPLP